MILVLSFLERPIESSIALLTVLIGIPFYFIFKRKRLSLLVDLGIPARSRITTEAQAIPNAAGIYEMVPTTDALFLSPVTGTTLLLSIGSGEYTAVTPSLIPRR